MISNNCISRGDSSRDGDFYIKVLKGFSPSAYCLFVCFFCFVFLYLAEKGQGQDVYPPDHSGAGCWGHQSNHLLFRQEMNLLESL